MRVLIAGGGCSGLAAAVTLAEARVAGRLDGATEVWLVDARQELGSPVRLPGWLVDVERWMPWLQARGLAHVAALKVHENGHGSVRREWVEKSLAIEAVARGVRTRLKQRIVALEEVDGTAGAARGWRLQTATGGPVRLGDVSDPAGWPVFDAVIDATGVQPMAAGWPGAPTALELPQPAGGVWCASRPAEPASVHLSGGVAVDLAPAWQELPPGVATPVEGGHRLRLERGDGTRECWWFEDGDPPALDGLASLPDAPLTGWLERMSGWAASVHGGSIDAALMRGVAAAETLVEQLDVSDS